MGLVETLGYYLIVFNAGHDTTRHSLSGAMAAFLDHPEEFARLKADPSLIKTAVEADRAPDGPGQLHEAHGASRLPTRRHPDPRG